MILWKKNKTNHLCEIFDIFKKLLHGWVTLLGAVIKYLTQTYFVGRWDYLAPLEGTVCHSTETQLWKREAAHHSASCSQKSES